MYYENNDECFVFNFFHPLSFKCFIDIIKMKKKIKLVENFHSSNFKDFNEYSYKNEIIIPFINKK